MAICGSTARARRGQPQRLSTWQPIPRERTHHETGDDGKDSEQEVEGDSGHKSDLGDRVGRSEGTEDVASDEVENGAPRGHAQDAAGVVELDLALGEAGGVPVGERVVHLELSLLLLATLAVGLGLEQGEESSIAGAGERGSAVEVSERVRGWGRVRGQGPQDAAGATHAGMSTSILRCSSAYQMYSATEILRPSTEAG